MGISASFISGLVHIHHVCCFQSPLVLHSPSWLLLKFLSFNPKAALIWANCCHPKAQQILEFRDDFPDKIIIIHEFGGPGRYKLPSTWQCKLQSDKFGSLILCQETCTSPQHTVWFIVLLNPGYNHPEATRQYNPHAITNQQHPYFRQQKAVRRSTYFHPLYLLDSGCRMK